MITRAAGTGALAAGALGLFYALVVGGVGGLAHLDGRPRTTGRGWR
jgi:hypothetical protein